MNNYLLILKSTIEVYIHGTLESSNEDVRKVLNDGLNETLKHQSRTYNEMVNYGWYKVENVNSQNICKCYKKVCNK
jgi:spore coat protein CotF